MDPRLKKLAFILPLLIIFGVYKNYIPVGPGIKSFFKSKEAVKPMPKAYPIVEKVIGEVMMKEKPSYPAVKLKGGELLKEGASIATGEKSAAILAFRSYYNWQARLSENTQVNIDELMKMDTEDKTIFNLVTGAIMMKMKNTSGTVRNMNVRTKYASFAVRGTTFAVLSDGEKRSLMTVQEGVVIADNYKLTDKSKVIEGHSYLVNRDGDSKIILDLDAVNLYDWNVESPVPESPSIDEVIAQTGDVGPTLDDQEKVRLTLLKEIDEKIAEFKSVNTDLMRELETLNENAVQSRQGLKEESVKVNKDIKCLETSAFECNLFTEKILIAKGFPRMWGNPRYKTSLVVELQKYLVERNEEVAGREDEAKILAKLMTARSSVLKTVEEDRKNVTHIEKIIPTLQDERLRR
ncbi:MAG: FecR family protein [Bdellovibrionota bacterium]